MKNFRSALFILVGSLTMAPLASAAVDTDNLEVTATVENGCIITAASVDFGLYSPQDPDDLTALGDIMVRCNEGATATITLGQGDNATAASLPEAPERQMAGTVVGSRLAYGLFSDGAGTVWGDTAATGVDYVGAALGAEETLTVHGTIPALQGVPAGDYLDTVVATITF